MTMDADRKKMIALIIILLICLVLATIFESCNSKTCPAYAKNNIEHGKIG
jgi:regulatory protein YycI of two-component signal transduction system YycFG